MSVQVALPGSKEDLRDLFVSGFFHHSYKGRRSLSETRWDKAVLLIWCIYVCVPFQREGAQPPVSPQEEQGYIAAILLPGTLQSHGWDSHLYHSRPYTAGSPGGPGLLGCWLFHKLKSKWEALQML